MSELHRLMGEDSLARPQFCFAGAGRRDPSPVWDAWFDDSEFSPTDRRRWPRFMGGAVTPDTLASWLDCSIDEAMRLWRVACLAELKSCQLEPIDTRDWEWSETRHHLGQIVGPQEIAELLAVQVGTVHQWRKRGLMPDPERVISSVPLWLLEAIEVWATATGRLTLEEIPAF